MKHFPRIVSVVLSALSISATLEAQRPGGEIRKRADDQNRVYFEVFADHVNGNHGDPAPMRAGNPAAWPRRVAIRGESFWMIDRSSGGRVDAGGDLGSARKRVAPEYPRGALIARWVSLDVETPLRVAPETLPTKPLSGWWLIGKKATLDIPIPAKVRPRPFQALWQLMIPGVSRAVEFEYSPLVLLQYLCNDDLDGFRDNDGWLHVYQSWIW